MDIISHTFAGVAVSKCKKKISKYLFIVILIASIIPDIGEIPIQLKLSEKNLTNSFIYDSRTSDQIIANQNSITWLYDLTHSLLTPIFFLMIGFIVIAIMKKQTIGIYFNYFAIGQLSHIILDSFSHGKVWALKLFYPISDTRYRIFEETFGNWWDFKPQIDIPFISFKLPVICIYFWLVFIIIILIQKMITYKKEKKVQIK